MQKLRVLLSIFIVLCVVSNLNAQKLQEDLKKMNLSTNKGNQFHAQITTKIYKSEESKTPKLTQQYEIKKKGKDLYYQLDQKRILINSKSVITINDDSRLVTYSKNENTNELTAPIKDMNLDSIVDSYDSIQYNGTNDAGKHYTLYKKESVIPVIEVYLNKTGEKINKLVYHYDEEKYPNNSLVEINYIKWTNKPVFASNDFSEKKYIRKVDGKMKLTTRLKDYELIINN